MKSFTTLVRFLAPMLAGALMAIPASGVQAGAVCFQADQDNGHLAFSGAQESSEFTGQFESFKVEYCMPEDRPEDGRIAVTVVTESANTRNRDRDGALRGEDFFHVSRFPEAVWTSNAIRATGNGFTASGTLTIRGIEGDTPVDFTLEPQASGWRMIGQSRVRRLDFQVGTGDADLEDTDFIRNEVGIAFELELMPAG